MLIPKFRAWHKEQKWLGQVTHICFAGVFRCVMVGEPDSPQRTIAENCPYDEVELMQWTGLKDKLGKDIYEGDIVCEDFGGGSNTYIIYRDNSTSQLYAEEAWHGECIDLDEVDLTHIIGNKWENPELLKESEL